MRETKKNQFQTSTEKSVLIYRYKYNLVCGNSTTYLPEGNKYLL